MLFDSISEYAIALFRDPKPKPRLLLCRHVCRSHMHVLYGTSLCPIWATGWLPMPISVIMQTPILLLHCVTYGWINFANWVQGTVLWIAKDLCRTSASGPPARGATSLQCYLKSAAVNLCHPLSSSNTHTCSSISETAKLNKITTSQYHRFLSIIFSKSNFVASMADVVMTLAAKGYPIHELLTKTYFLCWRHPESYGIQADRMLTEISRAVHRLMGWNTWLWHLYTTDVYANTS